jgi:hypothetical protein
MVTLLDVRRAYTSRHSALIRRTGTFTRRVYEGLGSWRDEDVTRFTGLTRPVIEGVKLQAANLTNAYYQQIAQVSGERFTPSPPTAAELSTSALRNGPDFDEVYTRPFVTTRTGLASGQSLQAAVVAGGARALQIAMTDINLATSHAGRKTRSRNNNIVGYRRVLTGRENCALCTIASTQRYRVNDLKPIHPACDCGEEPIYGDFDPGQVIDPELLEQTQALIQSEIGFVDYGARDAGLGKVITAADGSTRMADYTDLIISRNHGEYGPTLVFRDQRFTGPADIPAVFDAAI